LRSRALRVRRRLATDAASTELAITITIRCDPTSRLNAKNAEIDRIAFGRDNAVFADDAVLLASRNYLAGEE
jgi:hypothetical protein